MTLEQIAECRGFAVRRSRKVPGRVWLIRDGRLFSPAGGHDEATARSILATRAPIRREGTTLRP